MKNTLLYFVLTLSLLTLAACGGGGGGGVSTQTSYTTYYTLTFASSGNGTLTGAASQTIAEGASSRSVIAIPASGYHFVNWTEGGSIAGVNATLTVTNVTADHRYVANFAIDTLVKTIAIHTINLTGTLPTNTGIAGASFMVTLPANVTPAMTNSAVTNGVVMPSGTFAGGTQTPPIYTAATASRPGTLTVTLVNTVTAGVSQVGEVATITLQLANGATPTASSLVLSAVSVIDATIYTTINGMGAKVANVTLH